MSLYKYVKFDNLKSILEGSIRLPYPRAFPFQQQQFHPAAGVLPPSVKPSRNDPTLVKYHYIAGPKVLQKLVESLVFNPSGGPVQHQQSG